MSNFTFLLVIVAIGLGYYIYFERRKKNWQDRHPGEKHNPLDEWLTGKRPEDKDEDREP